MMPINTFKQQPQFLHNTVKQSTPSMPLLNLNQFSYMTNKQSLSPVLDLNVGVIENEAVQFTSVLRKRRVKMNRHKLKKRRKKQRFLTRKATK
jgi:tRNA G10  N-methylase Trm11